MLPLQLKQAYLHMYTELLEKYLCNGGDALKEVVEQTRELAEDTSCIERWHAKMTEDLPAHIKYGKALKRMFGNTCVYMALHYRDVDAIVSAIPSLENARAEFDALSSADRVCIWDAVGDFNQFVCRQCGFSIPDMPSKDAIQKNIDEHRRKKSCQSLTSSFRTCIADIFAAGGSSVPDTMDADVISAAFEKWPSQMKQTCGDVTWGEACLHQDVEVLATIPWIVIPDLKNAVLKDPPNTIKYLVQMNSYASASAASSHSLPSQPQPHSSGVMGEIEKQAQKLASSMSTSGKAPNLSDVDFAKIGQDVLSNCSQSDMQDFISNMGNIMPHISAMASGLSSRK